MVQLRTEAEKFYKEYVKDKGQGAITLNVIDIMMAFHAQQSKQDITDEEIETLASNWFESFENTEKKGYTKYDVFKAGFITGQSQQSKDRDAFTIAFTDWVVYESCCSSATKGKSITELLEIYKSNNLKK